MKPLPVSSRFLGKGNDDFWSFVEFGFDRVTPHWVLCDTFRPIVHIGPGVKSVEFETHILDYPEFNGECDILPFEDNTVGGIFAVNVLEHLADPRHLIREASRVLAGGCPFNIFVPHPDSIMYKEDLDHKSKFVLDTWDNLLDNPYYTKGHDGYNFQVGMNIKIAFKEDNTAIATQLIKNFAVSSWTGELG